MVLDTSTHLHDTNEQTNNSILNSRGSSSLVFCGHNIFNNNMRGGKRGSHKGRERVLAENEDDIIARNMMVEEMLV